MFFAVFASFNVCSLNEYLTKVPELGLATSHADSARGSFNRGSTVLIAAQCAVAYRYILQGHLFEICALISST
jgi:hypothetical protein